MPALRGRLWISLLTIALAGCGGERVAPAADSGIDAFSGPADCAPGDAVLDVVLDDGRCVPDDTDDDDDGTPDDDDCAPRDPTVEIVLADGACVLDDADDDDDGMLDEEDCAPRDPELHVTLADGACVPDDVDDDDDGVVDVGDCAPRDGTRAVTLDDGTCVADDADDDDDGALDATDCAPRDATRAIRLADGACVPDDADDDDDGVADDADCAPADAGLRVTLADGRCLADDGDDDDDGTADEADCASLDAAREVTLADGACVADDADDDDDGAPDATDCAPLDRASSVTLTTGSCVADDADDDDDGAPDAADCAPLDPDSSVSLADGSCVADDDDDDDDGAADGADCAPRDPTRWLSLDPATCVADDADDDDDGTEDGLDCSPRDRRYATGACDVGDVDTTTCGSDVGACVPGTRTRTCLASCAYGPWGECGGTYVAPVPEACGTGLDEDCDGDADEGCACEPVAPGAAGSFPVAGAIRNLRIDPVRCLLYGFDFRPSTEPSYFVVFDTRLKRELTRITLGTRLHAFDVARDGSRIAIGYPDRRELWVLYPPDWTPVVLAVSAEIFDVEVTASGLALVAADGGFGTVDLETGAHRLPGGGGLTNREMELGPDDRTLFIGGVNTTNGTVERWELAADGTITQRERGPRGLADLPRPYLTVSADGRLVAWGGAILDAADLHVVYGSSFPWHLDAFDARGRIVAAGRGLIDVGRVRETAEHWDTSTSVLVSADEEVWWFDSATGSMHYANVADFLDPALLGRHEWPPRPLDEYSWTDLVSDPNRPWLYAIDGVLGEVVVFDRETLTPVTAIEVGRVPTDAELDPAGRYLYTGHMNTWGVARVDLDELTYAGLVPTHVQPYDIASPRPGRVVSAEGEGNDLSLSDTFGAAVLDTLVTPRYHAALAVAPDGFGIYVGDSGLSSTQLAVYDTTGDQLTFVRESPFADGVWYPARGIVTVPGTRDVFWGEGRWDTDTLARRFSIDAVIRTVTPDGRLAISPSRIRDARTGAYVATLPVASNAQALSPDGRTLYLGFGSSIRAYDLSPYLTP